jgi:hypothetical protein
LHFRTYAHATGVDIKDADAAHAWRYFRDCGSLNFAAILLEYLCGFFGLLRSKSRLFSTFTCTDLEAVISHPKLRTSKEEIRVLQAVIDWAKKRSSEEGGFSVGETVRVRPDTTHKGWAGVDCVIKAITDASSSLLIEEMHGMQILEILRK